MNPTAWAYYGNLYTSATISGVRVENRRECSTCVGGTYTTPKASFEYGGTVVKDTTGGENITLSGLQSASGSCVNSTPIGTSTDTWLGWIAGSTTTATIFTAFTANVTATSSSCPGNNSDRSAIADFDITISSTLAAPAPPTTGTAGNYFYAYTSTGTLSGFAPADPTQTIGSWLATNGNVGAQSSVRNFRLRGAPSTDYDVEIFVNTYTYPTAGAATTNSEIVTVTTDSSGIADFTYTIPQPPSGFQSAYEGVHIITEV